MPSPSPCASCSKSPAPAAPHKFCSRCKVTAYCSRDCQKAHWKTHKKTCDRGAAAASGSTSASASAPAPAPGPPPGREFLFPGGPQIHASSDPAEFLQARYGNVLLNDGLSEKDIYKRLIDSYRMRVEDEYTFNGNAMGLYGGGNPVRGFEEFLHALEAKGGLLPAWWKPEKRRECVKLGRGTKKVGEEWCDLRCAVEKHDVQEHYGDMLMPMKLRVLAEKVYGPLMG